MKGSVIEGEHSQSTSPGVVSMGEFKSPATRLLWDLNHCKATGEGLWRMCQILNPDASQITSVNISIMCLKAKTDRSICHQNACFALKRSAHAVPRTTKEWLGKLLPQLLQSYFPFLCLAGTRKISTPSSGLANPAVQHSSALELS